MTSGEHRLGNTDPRYIVARDVLKTKGYALQELTRHVPSGRFLLTYLPHRDVDPSAERPHIEACTYERLIVSVRELPHTNLEQRRAP